MNVVCSLLVWAKIQLWSFINEAGARFLETFKKGWQCCHLSHGVKTDCQDADCVVHSLLYETRACCALMSTHIELEAILSFIRTWNKSHSQPQSAYSSQRKGKWNPINKSKSKKQSRISSSAHVTPLLGTDSHGVQFSSCPTELRTHVIPDGAQLVEGLYVEPRAFVSRSVQHHPHGVLLQQRGQPFVHRQVFVAFQVEEL